MAHLVTAVIKPHKLDEVKAALPGYGRQGGKIGDGKIWSATLEAWSGPLTGAGSVRPHG